MSIERNELFRKLTEIFSGCEGNVVPEDKALEGCAGLVMYEEPLFGVSSADDALYTEYKKDGVIGSMFMGPEEWLPGAKSVVSFFLPFTERVRASNRSSRSDTTGDASNRSSQSDTSPEWLHARIEGQAFLNSFAEKIREYFESQGEKACVPSLDERFGITFKALAARDPEGVHINSRWSERHAAYVSGLGTFCLTRGLISAKGVAGRYGSVIVTQKIEPDERPYTGIYDYCINCGACIAKCPAGAISLEHGKNRLLCREWVESTKKRYVPRYGCGKCQVGVPCENRIPGSRINAAER